METSDRLDFAECLSSPRTQWPAEFNQPPLKYFPRIQKVILKVLAAIFKDQRAINHQVIGAVRDATDCINSPWEQLDQLNLLYKKLEFSQARLQAKLHRDFTLPKNQKKNQEAEENQNFVGTFYTAFENQFRGSEGEVSDRLTEYLTLILDTQIAGKADSPIIDIGCGRGEWLELLRKRGLHGKGVDTNSTVVKQCQSKNLDVILADALVYLDSVPAESLGAVTGFHIIEHLPFNILLRLFQKIARALKPGGIVIFETPNPHNLLVSFYSFYLDPTHRNPLPPQLVQFAAEYFGLKSVRTLGLHPYPDSEKFSGDHAEKLNDYLRSFQDYALIGYRQ